jgi:outer membrane receptor protein involved in Fe transport
MTPVVGRIESSDLLPGVNAIYSLGPQTNLRLAASQTVSRPDFRELSEFEFTDIIGGYAVIGNPGLKRALIRNLDLRWENSHGNADLLAVSVFHKTFINPIEMVIQPSAQHRISFENAMSADNYGMEMEIRQSLGALAPELAGWAANANLTLLKSNIQLSDSTRGIQTSQRRPLHGQSPYLVNFNLRYRARTWRTEADLFLHAFGKRISEVGTKPLPDIYEMPHPELDLALQQPIGLRWTVKASVTNLLNPEVQFKQGGEITERYRIGQAVSLGLTFRN